MPTRRVLILGSTGSIGSQAIEVIEHLNRLADAGASPDRFRIVGLAAGSNLGALTRQAEALGVRELALARENGEAPPGVRTGPDAAERLVREVDCDLVVAAIVGFAGVRATLAAVGLGRDVALANKESLVVAGALVVQAARDAGAMLLPIDSEHSALWQCLGHPRPPCACGPHVRRAVITASGGPFRDWPADRLQHATPEQALDHPTWSMGPKVTIDSATLMNKALEIIEAHWLFGLAPDRIDALLHPQSIIHAMVEHVDGSVVAQMSAPDMRTPIQHALSFPHHCAAPAPALALHALSRLELAPIDRGRFPSIDLAYRALRAGGTAGAVLNAANEEAVSAFLDRRIGFGDIVPTVAAAMEAVPPRPVDDLQDVLQADHDARRWTRRHLRALTPLGRARHR